MTDRDYATDYPTLLHILVDKVRWFTEESVKQAHRVIDEHVSETSAAAPVPPVAKAAAKKSPPKRG